MARIEHPYPPLTLYHKLTRNTTFHRILVIIQFEPSWIFEFVNALAMAGWGFGMMASDDYGKWTLGTWVLPMFGLLMLPLRLLAIVSTSSPLRASLAIVGVVWWGLLSFRVYDYQGFIGAVGVYSALMWGDFFTLMKFTTAARYYTDLEARREQH